MLEISSSSNNSTISVKPAKIFLFEATVSIESKSTVDESTSKISKIALIVSIFLLSKKFNPKTFSKISTNFSGFSQLTFNSSCWLVIIACTSSKMPISNASSTIERIVLISSTYLLASRFSKSAKSMLIKLAISSGSMLELTTKFNAVGINASTIDIVTI